MSGDSPNSHRNEIFDFKEGRSSPGPATSKEVAVQSGSGVIQASVLVEPDKDKQEENKDFCSPISSSCDERRYSESDPEKTIQLENLSFNSKRKGDQERDEKKKLNGDIDKLDGVWVPSQDTRKKQSDEDDDNCAVKCLYYTMQCCECVIV